MKQLKKILSLVIALAFVLAFLTPVTAKAALTPPTATKVVVTKVGLESLTGWPKGGGTDTYNGTQISDMGTYFGTHTLMPGVAFKITDANGVVFKNGTSDYWLTDANGQINVTLGSGTWTFNEVKSASTYVGPNGEVLTDAAAVPFTLVLPMVMANGNYFDDSSNPLYVYPKNTDEKPIIDKNFAGLANPVAPGPKNLVGHQIGDLIPYEIITVIPAKSNYMTANWSDRMTEGLTFDPSTLVITVNGTELIPTDYVLSSTPQGFDIKLTTSGLDKISNQTAPVTVKITYSAVLNENAVVDIPESNDVTFNYGNNPDHGNTPVPVTPKDGEIKVDKTFWNADGTSMAPPAGVEAKVQLYNANTGVAVGLAVTLNAANGWTYTWTGLDMAYQYKVVEMHITGYSAEYLSTGTGLTSIKIWKDNNPGPLTPEEPKVVTYGKQFVKTGEAGARLSGAEFVVKDSTGKFLALKDAATQQTEINAYYTAEAAYQAEVAKATTAEPNTAAIAAAKTTRDAAYAAMNMQWTWVSAQVDAFKFTSNQDGQFAVLGLNAGTYQLVETKAPVGYAALTSPIDFTVGSGTASSGNIPFAVDGLVNNAQNVINIKVTIPQTGGIGTLIFGVVGVALMGGATVAMKNRKEEETEE
ncbi:MAG: SpaA isopeptide-forming pilin-related protein [Clostridiaceae bacterium]